MLTAGSTPSRSVGAGRGKLEGEVGGEADGTQRAPPRAWDEPSAAGPFAGKVAGESSGVISSSARSSAEAASGDDHAFVSDDFEARCSCSAALNLIPYAWWDSDSRKWASEGLSLTWKTMSILMW